MSTRNGLSHELSAAEKRRLLEQRLRERANAPRVFPLSFAQHRMWFLDQLHPGNDAYNLGVALRVKGNLHCEALQQSLQEITRRHEILRTVFHQVDHQPVQQVQSEVVVDLPLIDLKNITAAAREDEVRRYAQQEAQRPFDLAVGPLFRATLLRLADQEHVLLLTMHHIVSDGWSMSIFVRELGALYDAFSAGRPSPLEPLPIQYADFARWQKQYLANDVLEAQLAYWRDHLAGSPSQLELPTDRLRPAVQSYRGATFAVGLSPELSRSLHSLGTREGATLFMVLFAAFNVLLSRYSGQQDIVVGSSIANRNRMETEGLIGFFVNTLALRTNLAGDPTFRELLQRVRRVAIGAFSHQDLPFEKLVEELRPERNLSYAPLFQVEFTLQSTPVGDLRLPGLTLEQLQSDPGTSKFDLTLSLEEGRDRIHGTVEYNLDLFHEPTIRRMWVHFQTLLEGLVADVDCPISSLPLLSKSEYDHILLDWNATQAEYPDTLCLHHLFEQQAARTPDYVAAQFGDEYLTYAELERRSNQLAHFLRDSGAGPDVPVGLCVERSLDLVVALLGILKAGSPFLPLETDAPALRLRQVLEDAAAPICITQGHLAAKMPDGPLCVVIIDMGPAVLEQYSVTPPAVDVTSDHLVSIYYTSGSTGKPKGVANVHRGWVNRMHWMQRRYQLGAHESVLQKTTLTFDDAAVEFFWPLAVGGRIALMEPHLHRDPRAILDAAIQYQVAVIQFVPSMLTLVVEAITPQDRMQLGCLRHVISSGEALKSSLVSRFMERIGAQLHNQWGATEVSIDSTFHTCSPADAREGAIIPVGHPLDNNEVYILDGQLQPVPVGVIGDLYIAGTGLARGYLNNPERTAEAFVPHPFCPGTRMYLTGDRGFFRADGAIMFIGRKDDQVKVRGQRVELAEIEAVLAQHPAVKQCAIVAFKRDDGYNLVAYCVLRAQPDTVSLSSGSVESLWEFLHMRLPQHMIPGRFVAMETLPITVSGKVDRNQLPDPGDERPDMAQEYVAPETEIQAKLAEIWQSVLGLERVGIHDNFFAIGGHSLLATQVVTRARELLQVAIPLQALFNTPTISALAAVVDGARLTTLPVQPTRISPRRGDETALPLSPAQERLWFLDQLDPNSSTYNVPLVLRLNGPLNVPGLDWSFNEVIRRHEALRTNFRAADGRAVQRVQTAEAMTIQPIDLRHLPEHEREAEALRLAAEESRRPFDLAVGPLVRVHLIRLSDLTHILVTNIHHIVFDGWSIGVLTRELGTLYTANLRGEHTPLAPLEIQYADYAQWQRQWLDEGGLVSQVAYWKQQLAGTLPVLNLPTDRLRPPVQTYRGAVRSVLLPAEVASAATALGRREGASLFMVLLAAFKVLLFRYTGQADIPVGSPVANRNQLETEALIGFFVNTVVLRSELSSRLSFHEVLLQVRRVALEAFANQDVPFEQVVEALQPERNLSHSPLFQVMFVLQNAAMALPQFPGLSASQVQMDNGTAKFDLTLGAVEEEGGLRLSLEYNLDLFTAESADRMLGHYQQLLAAALAEPGRPVGLLSLLTEAERRTQADWNTTEVVYPPVRSLTELVELQVELTPDAVAVICEGRELTYSELNRRANQLAHHLRAGGAGPDYLIGVCIERSLEMVVGLLGVLKAGGAYVPIDPTYPAERLAYMLQDSAVPVLLTQAALAGRLPSHSARTIRLDADWPEIASEPQSNPVSGTQPDHVAYMIYTSGSTGKPKGALVPHRGICNRLLWMQQAYGLDASDRVLQKTPFSFDVSVWEFFWPLITGACLVMARPDGHKDSAYLATLIREQQITTLHFVPSMLSAFLEEPDLEACQSLRRVICSGEALTGELTDRFFARINAPLHNLYGPTEASVDVTYWECQRSPDTQVIPIGRPIANTRIHLLDPLLQPMPMGVVGELYIGGVSLARGYLNRPDLTAEKFIPDPFCPEPGARLYRTGDLARYLPDGTIEYLGRIDHQVKMRGFRIELGEVESVLIQHPAVREAVVVAREESPGDKRLVAYVVPAHETDEFAVVLSHYLRNHLPEYMIPSTFVLLESLPLSPNGKLDRRALPAPSLVRPDLGHDPVTPTTATEQALAGIWRQVLGIDSLGVHDQFFALGGHSLDATRVMSRIERELGVRLPLKVLFEAPTIARLARRLDERRAIAPRTSDERIPSLPQQEAYALSRAQLRLWFQYRFAEQNAMGHIYAHEIVGPLQVDGLHWALEQIAARHTMFRTTFAERNGVPVQIIHSDPRISAPYRDVSHLPPAEQEEILADHVQWEREHWFDLTTGPLLRLALFRLAKDRHVLFQAFHHIAYDGWSTNVIVQDLTVLYRSFIQGSRSADLPPALQYVDVAAWQNQRLAKGELAYQGEYWRSRLAGFTGAPRLPYDLVDPATDPQGASVRETWIDAHTTAQLRAVAKNQGATLYMTLLAVLKVWMSLVSSQSDITVGSPFSGRTHPELEEVVGTLVNPVVLRTDLSGNPSLVDVLERVTQTSLEAQAHQDYPFDLVLEDVRPHLQNAPLYLVVFVVQNAQEGPPLIDGLTFRDFPLGQLGAHRGRLLSSDPTMEFDLHIEVFEQAERLKLVTRFHPERFRGETIETFIEQYRLIAAQLVAAPEQRLAELAIRLERHDDDLFAV